MAISSPGIGSGLDISGIISSLIAAEEAPAQARFNRNESTYQAKLSALGLLKSSLSSFQTSLTTLKDTTSFQKRSITSTDSTLVSASADETAIEGSYSVEINRLAQAHKMSSTDFSAPVTGVLDLTDGTNSLSVDASAGMTLDELAAAINSEAESSSVGLSATVISGDAGVQRLILTASNSGNDKRIQVTSDTIGLGLSMINPLAAESELDAEIVVDGLTLTRDSNSITDVISGVTLNLNDVTTSAETISVSLNTGSVKAAVNSFVSTYNELMTTMGDLSAFDPESGTRSILLGDATLRAVEYALRNELSDTVSGLTGNFNSLSGIGISTERDGSITLDSDILDQAIETNFDDIGELFASENGVANRFDTLVEAYVSSSGIIDARIDGINISIDDIGDQREALARKLAKLEARYLSQFTAMDLMISQLQATSTYLTGAFENLPGSTFNKK